MKTFYHILGGLFLIGGIGWAIYIVVAVATHTEGYTALSEMIGALAFHAVFMFLGAVFTGLGLRFKKATA